MDAADKLALIPIIGGALLAFVMLIFAYSYDMARRRRRRARAADFDGVLEPTSGGGRKLGSSARRRAWRPGDRPVLKGRGHRASDAGVFPSYIFVADGGGAHCSSDGGGGGACDGGGGS